jgi:cyclopropane fatty-acyl-phospholipid synthase-like methyltransferase
VNLDESRYARLRWNTPLSDDHAALLLDRLDPTGSIVDLGCGWGELLLSTVERSGGTGIGVDTDPAGLARGRAGAAARGLADRVTFVEQPAADWRGKADHALCVGASHALGGSRAMLEALAEVVPRGRVLVGDACWPSPPTPAALDIFGDSVLPLVDLVEACRATGWRVLHLTTADQREWDDFESRHRAGREEWLLANENDPRAAEVRDQLDHRRREYLTAYRGVLGLAYLVLAR